MPTLLVRAHVVDLQWSKREGKRQMIGDPPPWISIFYGKRVDQQPGAKVDAKDNVPRAAS